MLLQKLDYMINSIAPVLLIYMRFESSNSNLRNPEKSSY